MIYLYLLALLILFGSVFHILGKKQDKSWSEDLSVSLEDRVYLLESENRQLELRLNRVEEIAEARKSSAW
jgi:hypothetical protein